MIDSISSNAQINRVYDEWRMYEDKYVIAFDYDNTVYDYHKRGEDYEEIISIIRLCKKIGCTLVLLTCRDMDTDYDEVYNYLSEMDIIPDYINKTPEWLQFRNSQKVYYNILLDDRSGLSETLNTLYTAYVMIQNTKYIEKKRITKDSCPFFIKNINFDSGRRTMLYQTSVWLNAELKCGRIDAQKALIQNDLHIEKAIEAIKNTGIVRSI